MIPASDEPGSQSNLPWLTPLVRTKVVATYGPACAAPERLTALLRKGVDVFRVNMAHGSPALHEEAVRAIRTAAEGAERTVAILADLAGPKMRLGELPGGEQTLVEGAQVRIVRGNQPQVGSLTTTYPPLVEELVPGNRVMLADGTVSLVVEKVSTDAALCRVVQGGTVRSRQGVNLPGARISARALGEDDVRHARWAAQQGIDFVGLSFVRSHRDVAELKAMLASWGSAAHVVAKIEKQEAIDELEQIIDAADAVMVARGDLGVEIDIARVPMAQKHIVAACNARQKPVIIATQMLDSMQRSRWPTRAEASDVANAILDGADACMLSGETAIGEHPEQAVEMLRRIAQATEGAAAAGKMGDHVPPSAAHSHPVTQAVVQGAREIARQIKARLLFVASHTGATTLAMSKQRTFVPIVGISDDPAALRKMCLYWGVFPVPRAPTQFIAELLGFVDHFCRERARLQPGERVVVVTGSNVSASGHNIVLVHELASP